MLTDNQKMIMRALDSLLSLQVKDLTGKQIQEVEALINSLRALL